MKPKRVRLVLGWAWPLDARQPLGHRRGMFTPKFRVTSRTEHGNFCTIGFRCVVPKEEIPNTGIRPQAAPEYFEACMALQEFANYPVGAEFELVPAATQR